MIAPDVVLTAAHCVAAIEQYGLDFLGVTFDPLFDPETSVVLSGTPHANPGFPGPASDTKDIAVIVLNEEVTGIEPAELPTASLLDQLADKNGLRGQQFTAVGYGRTERTHEPASGAPVFGEPGIRMYSTSTFDALNKTFLRLSQNPSTGDGGACYGDSGGPNFLGAGSTETNIIASITITGDAVCRATNVTYRLDTPSARAFLEDYVELP